MSANSNGGLAVGITIGPKGPIGIAESEAAKEDVVDRLFCGNIAFENQQLLQFRCDHLGAAQVFARLWPIAENSGLAIEIPFAWRIETVRRVLDVVLRVVLFVRFARIA